MTRKKHGGLRKRCDCPKARWPKCAHPWHMNFKWKGTHYRLSLDREIGKPITSKGGAEAEADRIRTEIRAGTFRSVPEPESAVELPATPATSTAPLTLSGFWNTYIERLGRPISENTSSCFKQFSAFVLNGAAIGEMPFASITEDDIEAFVSDLRRQGLAASTRNKYIQTIKAMFRWALRKGYLTRNPAEDSIALRREKHARRDRRLEPGEEGRLLAHAGPHLQRLIIAALETGCRRGELLTLQWRDVNLQRREITVRPEKSKTRTGRVIPMSARLKGVLDMIRTRPDGRDFGPDAYVFGNEVGEPVCDIKRAWETAVLKAHARTPTWTRDHALSPASRGAFRDINLTFHDLRHEAGSRLLESGWALHNVAHMLGHANISQTSTYLNATRVGLQESMRRLDNLRCAPVAQSTGTDQPPLSNAAEDAGQHPLVN